MAKNLIRMLCEVFCQRLRTFFSHEVPREEIFPYLTSAISKIGNGESRNGERGTGNGERGISKIGNI